MRLLKFLADPLRLFFKEDLPDPPKVPNAPSLTDPAVEEAKRKALLANRKADRRATVLTSGAVGGGEDETLVKTSVLLGT